VFGPAGAASLSKPPLRQLDVDAFILLSPEKLAQRVGALSQTRLDTIIRQFDSRFPKSERETLDALIDRLEEERQQNPSPEVDAKLVQLEVKLRELSRALSVAQTLKERKQLEERLAAQPAWVACASPQSRTRCVRGPVRR
jgi:hypothetical protein